VHAPQKRMPSLASRTDGSQSMTLRPRIPPIDVVRHGLPDLPWVLRTKDIFDLDLRETDA
jgi:hypothetical protein